MAVVIVESPAKAKTINKYLGKDFKVLASYGHVRDLPSKDGSVKPDEDFAMTWEVDTKSKKQLADIAAACKGTDKLILATDPDREGEAISWHLLEALYKRRALKKSVPVERVVFNAITKTAVTQAMKEPREVDMELVEAYLARRALDYLVGFNLSPVLWRKLPGSRSAGRVQSVCLRLVVEREMEIDAFKAREYWSVRSNFTTPGKAEFESRLTTLDGKKLERFDLANEKDAARAISMIEERDFSVKSVEAKPATRNPSPPFMTSTLQQEASRKLGLGAQQAMRAAQILYEQGHITYMRTDGIDMAPEAIAAVRDAIGDRYSKEYVPSKPREYKVKAKNAQEAHEAIRPTDFTKAADDLKIDGVEKKLYDLIWKRAVSSQMESARLERTVAEIESKDGKVGLRATGQVIKFDGFLKVYEEGKDETSSDDEDSALLPAMSQGDALTKAKGALKAAFAKAMKSDGTTEVIEKADASAAAVLSKDESALALLIAEDKGRLVTAFLENYFKRYVEYDFTAELEEKLDTVSAGKMDWKLLLKDFWKQFSADIGETKELRVSEVLARRSRFQGSRRRHGPEDLSHLRQGNARERDAVDQDILEVRRVYRLHQLS